jgi:hypothetical protein
MKEEEAAAPYWTIVPSIRILAMKQACYGADTVDAKVLPLWLQLMSLLQHCAIEPVSSLSVDSSVPYSQRLLLFFLLFSLLCLNVS